MSERISLETLNTAIEKLAEATMLGFELVGLRFDRLEARIDRMELRQDQMAYRFEMKELTSRVERIEGELSLS
jgi:hypothetical protein